MHILTIYENNHSKDHLNFCFSHTWGHFHAIVDKALLQLVFNFSSFYNLGLISAVTTLCVLFQPRLRWGWTRYYSRRYYRCRRQRPRRNGNDGRRQRKTARRRKRRKRWRPVFCFVIFGGHVFFFGDGRALIPVLNFCWYVFYCVNRTWLPIAITIQKK